jgi:hypothetical protein
LAEVRAVSGLEILEVARSRVRPAAGFIERRSSREHTLMATPAVATWVDRDRSSE